MLEASLRTLERAYRGGRTVSCSRPGGRRTTSSTCWASPPIPRAKGLSDFELPTFDDYDLCLHLACDDEQRLAGVELALVHGRRLDSAGAVDLSGILRWRETRTGFVGTGLPAAHQQANGIPSGNPVPASSPLFMGFKSGFKKNQAARTTSRSRRRLRGRHDDAGQLHAPAARQLVRGADDKERVARMYAPEVTPADVDAVHRRRAERAGASTRRRRAATASSATRRPRRERGGTASRGSSAATSTPSTAASRASTSSRSRSRSPTSSRPGTR